MNQLAGIPVSRIDTNDPLIAEWALERLETLAEQDLAAGKTIAARLFDTPTIGRLFEFISEYSLCQMLQTLAHPLFAGSMPALHTKWEEGEGVTAPMVLQLIAKLDPERAEQLIRESLNGGPGVNVYRLRAIRTSLPFLPVETSAGMAEELLQSWLSSASSEINSLYADELLGLTCRFIPARINEVLPLVLGGDDTKEHVIQARIHAIAAVVCGDVDDFEIVIDSYDEISSLKFVEISPLFTPDAPLNDCESAISELRNGRPQAAIDLFTAHQFRIVDKRIVNLLRELSADQCLLERLGEKSARHYIHCLLLAAVLKTYRVEHPNYDSLSLEDTIALLAVDIRNLPDFDRLADHLRGMDRSILVSLLIAALERTENNYGGVNVVRCMGILGFHEFIEPIILVTGSEFDYISEEAEKVLVLYGEEAVEAIIPQALEFEDGVFYLLGALSSIGGARVRSFMLDHFHDLYEFDREYAMHMIEAAPDERFIPLLAPYTNRRFPEVDKAYLLMHKLFGIRTAEIERMDEVYCEEMEEERRFRAAMDSGRVVDTVTPYLDLELECLDCYEVRVHRVHRVIISGKSPYVADEIICPDCGAEAEFEVTANGKNVISGAGMRLLMITDEEEKRKALEITPIRYKRYDIDGRSGEVGILDAVFHYQKEMDRRPNDPEPVIGLGTVYKNAGKYRKAELYLQQAIEMGPDYVEPYFTLASIAEERGEWLTAFTLLDKIRRKMPLVKLRAELPQHEKAPYLKTFAEFYNDMLDKSGVPGEYMEKATIVAKVGRNEPCPCGSGKKYKKCCLK